MLHGCYCHGTVTELIVGKDWLGGMVCVYDWLVSMSNNYKEN